MSDRPPRARGTRAEPERVNILLQKMVVRVPVMPDYTPLAPLQNNITDFPRGAAGAAAETGPAPPEQHPHSCKAFRTLKDVYLTQRGQLKNAFEKSRRAAYKKPSTSKDTAPGEQALSPQQPPPLPQENE